MRDEIFWGNLLGLLKRGKWSNLSLEEANALVALYVEAERRSKLSSPTIKKDPIKKPEVK